jgi:hypothetical protein
MFGRLFGKSSTVPDGPAPATSAAAPAAGPLAFGDRKNKRSALFGARQVHAESASFPVPAQTAARPPTPAPAAASAPTSPEAASQALRHAAPAAQAAAELGAAEALYALAPALRGQPPEEVFRTYQEARRTAGRTWWAMMRDFGITEESPPDAMRQAAQNVRDHRLYKDYFRARRLRDALVLCIDAEQEAYAPFIEQNPHVKSRFEADLRVALGQSGVRQAEQEARDLKPRFGYVAYVHEIQDGKGVVGAVVEDHGKGRFHFIAFDDVADFLKRMKGRKVKAFVKPDQRDPSRFWISSAFPCGKTPRDVDAR